MTTTLEQPVSKAPKPALPEVAQLRADLKRAQHESQAEFMAPA